MSSMFSASIESKCRNAHSKSSLTGEAHVGHNDQQFSRVGTAKTSTSLHIEALARHHKSFSSTSVTANLTSGFGGRHDSSASVLQRKKPIEEVILKTSIPGLSLIPGDSLAGEDRVTEALAGPGTRYSHERLKELLKSLKGFDTVMGRHAPLCGSQNGSSRFNFRLVTSLQRQRTAAPLGSQSPASASATPSPSSASSSLFEPPPRATTPSLTSSNRHSKTV